MHFPCSNRVATFTRKEALVDKFSPLADTPLRLEQGDYTFKYNYPLTTPACFVGLIEPRHSIIDILLMARRHYEAIYALEEVKSGKTENITGMLNRATSQGPFGIWGHHIDDLYFERVSINVHEKTITFGVGS